LGGGAVAVAVAAGIVNASAPTTVARVLR